MSKVKMRSTRRLRVKLIGPLYTPEPKKATSKGVTKAVKEMLAKRPAAVATTSRNKANGVLSSIPRVDAEQCLRMSKAEWCATETSRALCGVSRRVCVDLGFVFHESGDCANCLAMKGPAKAVKEMLAKRLPVELS